MSTPLSILRGADNHWTLGIASGTGPVLVSAHDSAVEWVSGSSLPDPSIRGHLLKRDEVSEDSPETEYFSRPLIQNIYFRPIGESAGLIFTTNSELFGG